MTGGQSQRFFITTSIPYVNARPHLGFALEIIQTDSFARFRRLSGDDVMFLTGTDDNSLSNVSAAEAQGVPTKELVERNAEYFEALKERLDLTFDDFIRTSSDPRHLAGARKIWQACDAAGDIYRKSYSGLYCINCERFYAEDELLEGLCPQHEKPLQLIEEENYFFRLSKYSAEVTRLIETDELRIVPASRRNEVLGFLKTGLEDLSISRSKERGRGWGLPVPGDDDQVMYVWFDALSNYINALGYSEGSDLFQNFWVEGDTKVHVIGKDIIRFHAVYWPAMLMSAGLPLPTSIFSHGFLTVDGLRMSKSRGNVVDPVELVAQYGVDSLRYFLLRRIHPTEDTNVTMDHFIRTHNSDLADQLGNLLSRVTSMIGRYYDGIVPGARSSDGRLQQQASGLFQAMSSAMNDFNPGAALAEVWDLIAEANRHVVDVEPWKLAKTRDNQEDEDKLATVLYELIEVLRIAAWGIAAFLPSTSHSILQQIGVEADGGNLAEHLEWGGYVSGTRIMAAPPLFPKLEAAGPAA